MGFPLKSLLARGNYWLTPVYDRLPFPLTPERPRRIHVYGVGTPRSGTVSLVELFRGFRAAHEPESRFYTYRVVDYLEGRQGRGEMLRYLRRRDRRLQLELDSSYINAEVVGLLAELFPQARFILTLRDCVSWTDSMANFLLNRPEFLSNRKPSVKRHFELRFAKQPYRHAKGEEVMAKHGLPSIASFLGYWAWHNRHVIDTVPGDRLLVMKTRDIGTGTAEAEAFLRLTPGCLVPQVHVNPAVVRHGLLEHIDGRLLADRVEEYAGDLMRRYYPEVLDRLTGLSP